MPAPHWVMCWVMAAPSLDDRLLEAWDEEPGLASWYAAAETIVDAWVGEPYVYAETASDDELNYRKAMRETLLRGAASSRLAIYHHVVRRRVNTA